VERSDNASLECGNALQLQARFANHAGLTPVAPSCVFATFRTMFDSRGTAFGSPNHGGLTPAALDFVFASRRTMFDSRCTMFGSPNHGGLMLVALAKKGRSVASAASVA
jgi:hypothetical protein